MGERGNGNGEGKARSADGDDALVWTFFRQWLKNPLGVAAISPSSRELAQRMLKELPEGARRVVELGGGTGVFTRALLDRGFGADDILVLELNQTLAQHLRERFPEVRVACADAREVPRIAAETGWIDAGPADAVISGLGLLSMARPLQQEILQAAFRVLAPHGHFVQFTYGPTNPVSREVMDHLGLQSRRAGFTLWNVPPATVFVYSRAKTRRVVTSRRATRPKP